MTTSKVFGISQAGAPVADVQQQSTQESVDLQKFEMLKDAIDKFVKKEITKEELKTIKESLV